MTNLFSALMISCVSLLALTSCSNKKADDLATAQQCLDAVPQSDPTQADNCMAYVQKHSGQQANVLKCAIKMTSGGLVENKIVKGYNALKDSSITNKEAAYMAVLSLDLPDVDAGYTKAVEANEYCKASGVPGLVYISSVIVAGSYMNKTIKGLTGSGVDITNPASIDTAITNMLNSCTTNPPAASCTTDLPTLGSTVVTVADAYCGSANADQSVCSSINNAVTSAGGDTTEVGKALFCYLQKKTYDTSTHACAP